MDVKRVRWTLGHLSMGQLGDKLLNIFLYQIFYSSIAQFYLQNQESNMVNLNCMMNLNFIIGNIPDA